MQFKSLELGFSVQVAEQIEVVGGCVCDVSCGLLSTNVEYLYSSSFDKPLAKLIGRVIIIISFVLVS